MIGTLFVNDRDIESDFSFVVTDLAGFPGMLSGAPRDVPLLDGIEMQGAILDPRLLRRKPGSAMVKGIITTASVSTALTALDALRNLVLSGGEVAIRSSYATDRQCLAVCTQFDGVAYQTQAINGLVAVTMTFSVAEGVAVRLQPDGYALTTTRVACPIGTAESRPVILVHGGGAAMTNPVITIRNAAGDSVQTAGFTVSLGANDALRIDCARGSVSKIAAGVITDGLAASYWTSGDYVLVLRPADGWVESAVYPSVELSSSTGTPVGEISYSRRYA